MLLHILYSSLYSSSGRMLTVLLLWSQWSDKTRKVL